MAWKERKTRTDNRYEARVGVLLSMPRNLEGESVLMHKILSTKKVAPASGEYGLDEPLCFGINPVDGYTSL